MAERETRWPDNAGEASGRAPRFEALTEADRRQLALLASLADALVKVRARPSGERGNQGAGR